MPLTEDQIARAKEEFAEMDTNGDGFITLDEYKAQLEKDDVEFDDKKSSIKWTRIVMVKSAWRKF